MNSQRADIMAKLGGKRIVKHAISTDRTQLLLWTRGEEDPVVLTVTGDCCSASWIEGLDTPMNLRGTVQRVEDREMPDLGCIPGQYKNTVDVVAYYGLLIVTDKGHCVVDYRNDSNGYYGGDIE